MTMRQLQVETDRWRHRIVEIFDLRVARLRKRNRSRAVVPHARLQRCQLRAAQLRRRSAQPLDRREELSRTRRKHQRVDVRYQVAGNRDRKAVEVLGWTVRRSDASEWRHYPRVFNG